jgi:hypothetical protein
MSMLERTMLGIALMTVAVMAPVPAVLAQNDRLQKIEERLNALEQRDTAASGSFDFIKTYGPVAFPFLGIALFCGLWARNSGRDFWLWFVAGLVFTIFALITVAITHAADEDQKAKKEAATKASNEALDL